MSRPPLFEFSGSAPANCAQKCTVQTPSDLNYCMYIFYKHYLNFETKMIFLCILIVWSHEEIIFICANVSCSYDATAAKSRYYFKWFQSKFKEKEKLVVACLSPHKKKVPSENFMSWSCRDGKEIRKACIIMRAQSNVLLVKTQCFKPIGRI